MPIVVAGRKYYRTAEVCRRVGISRSTLFRWIRTGLFRDVINFDRRGWRLFTINDIKRLEDQVNQISCKSSGRHYF